MNRTFATMLAATAVATSLGLAVAPTAHAANQAARGHHTDQRPCVSLREFRGTPPGVSRREMEKRWDMQGLGVRITANVSPDEMGTREAYQYKACGFSMDEVQIYALTVENPGQTELIEGLTRQRLFGIVAHGHN